MMAQNIVQQDKIERSVPRTHLFLSATIRFDRVTAAVRLRDLSESGARIEGVSLPAIGKTAQISRGSLQMAGTIVWREGKACGVRFDDPLVLDQWLPTQAARDQSIVDVMIADVRSGQPHLPHHPPEPIPIEPASGLLSRRLAEELAYVARLLDSLGEDLCGEPLLVMRHADKLQNLDISAQILGHVATVLVAERPGQAIEAIGMTNLRKRLQRKAL